ncbi:MAG: cytochrome c3 family protein, partial [Calditrichia bacterium]
MSQSIDDCLECHDDDTLTMVKNGKEISLNINPQAYENSPHHEISCIECHVGFDPDEEPHRANIEPVDCTPCHEKSEKSFEQSKHASEFSCTECHVNVHAPQERSALLRDCETCHGDAFRDYTESIHFSNKKGPRCFDCHTIHSFKIPGSDNCLSCHGKKEYVHTNILHKDLRFVLDYKESIHSKLIECSDCHSGHRILPGESPQSKVNIRNIPKTCSKCHKKEAEQYRNSEHGEAFASGFEDAPTCTGCHGEHDIHQITDSRSSVSREHEIEVCLRCHLDSPEVRSKMTHTGSFIADYEKSIHGRKIKEGNLKAAVCSDCHGGHEEMKASNPHSKVNKFNISKTCGQCHEQEANDFSGSIHAEALLSGVEEAPTCTDCHGEHEILEHSSPESPVAPQNVPKEVCGPCHNSVKLTEKYGLSPERFSSYNDSFHGLAVRFGDVEAANCASCHGVHKILPSTDPRSSVNKNNLVKTCGKCHPGANKNFTRGKVHITKEAGGDKIIFIITSIYLALIFGTIGAMALHNILDWFRKLKEQYRQRYEETAIIYPLREKRRLYIRMSLSERIQHFLLLISFFTLVFTGFMLKFPDAWWVM